jgi:hypothetical protein
MSTEQINIEEFNKKAFDQMILPFDQYSKEIKGALNTINETIKQSISNGYTFCNMNVDITKKVTVTYMIEEDDNIIKTTEESTVYPESDDINKWLRETIVKITEIKELNPRALENMKKQGIVPKKQAGEILLLLLICSRTDVHIAIYSPYQFDISEFINSTIGNMESFVLMDRVGYLHFTDPMPIKKRDDILQIFFNKLKEMGIYIVEETDDMIFYDE